MLKCQFLIHNSWVPSRTKAGAAALLTFIPAQYQTTSTVLYVASNTCRHLHQSDRAHVTGAYLSFRFRIVTLLLVLLELEFYSGPMTLAPYRSRCTLDWGLLSMRGNC